MFETTKSESTSFPKEFEFSKDKINSCYMMESCVLKVPVGTVWEGFKEFKFEKMAPSIISASKFLSGNPCQVGSTYQIEYKDGSMVTYMIVEISELKRCMTVDMIDCKPKQSFSSMLTCLRFCKITEDNTTGMVWKALFSNDVSSDVLKSKKEKVRNM